METDLQLDATPIQLQQPFKSRPKGKVVDPLRSLKRGIWLYFWLLLFEGALRKWFLPGLATPLLIVRDPIALWVVATAWNKKLIPSSIYIFGMVSLSLFGILTALVAGHGNIIVAIYGARMYLFHFPMIFVIGRVFDREEVVKMGKVTLWLSIPMAILIGMQFYSPQSAWVNRGLGDDIKGAGFSGALGFYRPPGTFSFTTGNTTYFSLVAAYVIYFLFNPKTINKILLIGASVSLIAAIPLSISRTLLFQVVFSVLFAVLAILRKPKNLGKAMVSIMGIAVLFAILSNTSFFQKATGVLTARFADAEGSEGGLEGTFGDRFLGGIITTLGNAPNEPFFGYGIGMGTKVGSQLLSGNRHLWLIAEAEWGRTIGEMGALMGLSLILLRVGVSGKMLVASYRRMARGDMLPWMLISFALSLVAQGSWGQPTGLGFAVIGGGLVFASLRNDTQNKKKPILNGRLQG